MKKISNLYAKVGAFFKEVQVEMKKVTWPNKTEILSYTVVVLVAVCVLSIIIGVEDWILGRLITLCFRF